MDANVCWTERIVWASADSAAACVWKMNSKTCIGKNRHHPLSNLKKLSKSPPALSSFSVRSSVGRGKTLPSRVYPIIVMVHLGNTIQNTLRVTHFLHPLQAFTTLFLACPLSILKSICLHLRYLERYRSWLSMT